jgi:hypothetical protein
MRKHRDCASGDYAYRAQRVAPELAAFVLHAHGRKIVATGRTHGAGRGCADVGKQAYAVAVCAKQYARKAAAGKSARSGENRNGLANVAEHAFYQAVKMVSHTIYLLKLCPQKGIVHFYQHCMSF